MNPLSCIHCVAVLVAVLGAGETFLQGQQESLPHPFHMTVSPTQIVAGITKDVALRCESNPIATVGHILRKVSKVRILKKVSQDEWQLMAVQRVSGSPELSIDKISASGRVIPVAVDATFLEIRWAVVDEDTFGVYRCDVVGTDEHNNSDVEMSVEVELKQGDIPTGDLISLLLQTKHDIETQIAKNARDIETFKAQKDYSSGQDLAADTALFTDEFLLRSTAVAWPGGKYALLQPSSGCPVDLAFFGGNSGFVRLHTESTDGDNNNSLPAQTHLSQPVITRSGANVFLYLRFCVVTREFSDSPWPEGSYCIHANRNQCPPRFSRGKIHLDTEDHQNADMHGGNVPFDSPSDLLFCCKDGPDSLTPMVLPADDPFYLYRRGGQCQLVAGMDVTEEFVEIDTENFLNGNSVAGTVPDNHLSQHSGVRIELCYYSKK